MTSPTRIHLHLLGLALLVGVLVWSAPAARAGSDDFEFGKKLAEARYFDYARKVYDAILNDPQRSEEAKDEARYGLALLRKEEAMSAAGRSDSKYEDIVKLFESAAADIEAFVQKNPKSDKAGQARLDVGTIRLAFVQWARELLDDPEEVQERGFDMGKLSDDARIMVDKAIQYFGDLKPGDNVTKPKPYQVLASYYFVISQYYRALVEPPCSPGQMSALEKAGNDLEEYIMFHDGQLLAVYAQDIYGLVWWEMAKCEEDPEKKFTYYMKAFEWFETCIYTEDEGPDHLRIITSGYYHIAQVGADAGRMPDRNFARDAATYLADMLTRHPTAWRTDNGLRALIEWSSLECKRGNSGKAIEVAKDAADRAKKAGKDYLERLANRKLNDFVSGGCGGSAVGAVSPDVLTRVAEDLFLAGQYRKAVRAYQQVIAATPDTTQAFLEYRWGAWRRMAQAYKQLGDRLGEALAYEPIHDAWKLGRIPHEKGASEDPNMDKAGYERRYAEEAMRELAEKTRSPVFQAFYQRIRDEFLKDYPDHSTIEAGEWNAAIDKWKLGTDQKDANDRRWKDTLKKALPHFANVSKQTEARFQDLAWVYMVRIYFELNQLPQAVKTAQEAWALWNTPQAKAQEEKFDKLRQRRAEAKSALSIWQARALKEQGKHEEVIALLKDYHVQYAGARDPYPSMAYDYLTQAYIAKGDIEEADRYYRLLLGSNPTYFNLSRITFLLAGHYNEQREAIQEKLSDVTAKLNDARKQLRDVSKEAIRLGALVSDLRKSENKAKGDLALNDERIKAGMDPLDPEILRAARDTIEEMKTKIPNMEALLKEATEPRDRLEGEAETLLADQAKLRQEIYEPLTRAAGYYYQWDRALKTAGVRRSEDNVAAFAGMFWKAGRLRPETVENWTKARELYEEYLAFPKIKKLPKTDPNVRAALAKLGDVYVNLAERESDPQARQALVMRAVELLQGSISEDAADNELVVAMLSDKVQILQYPYQGRRWRFPIPRVATVKELRDAVKKLGTPEGYPLPEPKDEREKKDRERALSKFRQTLAMEDDAKVKGYVVKPGTSPFDPILYRSIANSQPEFRLALAWIYSQTGREEDVPKAVNLTVHLTLGPLAVPEDTEIWWQARNIQLRVYLDTAERRLTEGTGSADAADWLERASNVFKGVVANFPRLGNEVIPGNKDRWKDMLGRLNSLRRKAGLVPVDVKIEDVVKPGGDAPPAGDE